jgi:hypothetical protein
MNNRHKRTLGIALARYLRAKRTRLYVGENAYETLVADLLELMSDEDASTAFLAFSAARYRIDARAATIQAIAIFHGGGMADDTDQAYEDFLLTQAGLSDHPNREAFVTLARQISAENDWGTRLYRFAKFLMATTDDEH